MADRIHSWSLPRVRKWESLYGCLHDAQIKRIDFRPFERTLEMDLRLGYPDAWNSNLKSVRICFEEVKHALVTVNLNWPGPVPKHTPFMDNEVWEQMLQEYAAKSAVTTMSLRDFKKNLRRGSTEVLEARWSQSPAQKVLELQGYAEDIRWYRRLISSKSLRVASDQGELTFDELLTIGMAAWKDWSSRED